MKIWGWDKKPSTSKGRLKAGDLFCFPYDDETYCFGWILKIDVKEFICIVEILDYISDRPEIDEETAVKTGRMIPPMNVKTGDFEWGNWRIIGHSDDYLPADYNELYLAKPGSGEWVRIDFQGNETPITKEERHKYISIANSDTYSDIYVKEEFNEIMLNRKFSSFLSENKYPEDPEELYRFANALFDANRYDDVINAVSSLSDDKQTRKTTGLLIASYNNTKQFDESLKNLEKYKSLYEDKMRIWYYFAAYAYVETKDYDNALTCIDGGFAECEREKEEGILTPTEYRQKCADFINLKGRRKRALEALVDTTIRPVIGGFQIENNVLDSYTDDGVTTEVVIPDGIRMIEADAFENCETIKSVVIPEGVERIYDAFTGCINLEKIVFPDSLKMISSECLKDTKWYKDQPKGQIIAGKILYQYTGDEEEVLINDSVRIIGEKAFLGNERIRKVVIPASVKEIGYLAFRRCSNLTEIQLTNGLESISYSAFEDCTGLEEIDIPDSVTKFSGGVFAGCIKLKEVILPDNIIGLYAGIFEGCKNLERVHLPANAEGMTDSRIGWDHKVEGCIFKGCEKLTEVTIPKGIKSILEETFAGCASIQQINITNPGLKFGKDTFGKKAKYPEALYKNSPELPLHLSDGDIKQYIDFDKLPDDVKATLFVRKQSKALLPFWEKSITKDNAKAIGDRIKELMAAKLSGTEKKNAAMFFEKYEEWL